MVDAGWDDTYDVLGEVSDERTRQIRKGFTLDHDDRHDPVDFGLFIRERLLRADLSDDDAIAREQYLQVAALAVACVETFDRFADRRTE